jgi:hypothetical protein
MVVNSETNREMILGLVYQARFPTNDNYRNRTALTHPIPEFLRGNVVGVVDPASTKVWQVQSESSRMRNTLSFVFGTKCHDGSGTPSAGQMTAFAVKHCGDYINANGQVVGSQLLALISQRIDAIPTVAPVAVVDDGPANEDGPATETVATNPVQLVVSDNEPVEILTAIPTMKAEHQAFVVFGMTGTDNIKDALKSTQYGFGDKKKNCGTELHKDHVDKANGIDNTLYANGYGRLKANQYDTNRICMLVSEDLFDAVGVKNFMKFAKDKLSLVGDLTAIVGTLGSMDCRKNIHADVKMALVVKHHEFIGEDGADAFVLDLNRTVKRTGTKAQALEAMSQAFFNF